MLVFQVVTATLVVVAIAVIGEIIRLDIRLTVAALVGAMVGALLVPRVVVRIVQPVLMKLFMFLLAASMAIVSPIIYGGGSLEPLRLQVVSWALTALVAIAAIGLAAVAEFVAVLCFLAIAISRRRYHRSYVEPPLLVVDVLLNALVMLQPVNSLMEEGDKWEVVRLLNSAAVQMRTGLAGLGGILDPADRAVYEGRCKAAGDVVQSYGLWVVLPTRDTRVELIDRLEDLVVNLTFGFYDALPTEGVVAEPSFGEKIMRLIRFLVNVAAGVVPLALIYLAKLAGLDLSTSGVGIGAAVFAIAWAAVVVISSVDENYSNRIAMVGEMASAIRSGSKG